MRTDIQPGPTSSTDCRVAGRDADNDWAVDAIHNGDVFFASPTQQLRSRGVQGAVLSHQVASTANVRGLFDRARQGGNEAPILFGLVPFDVSRRASFTIPRVVTLALTPHRDPHSASARVDRKPTVVKRQPVPPPEAYGEMVRKALMLFDAGDVNKIVLSRAMDVELDSAIDYEYVLRDLLRRNAHGYTFAVPIWPDDLTTNRPTAVMIGASPELLVRREGARVFINPLAGSIPRHADPIEDQARRDGLAISEKDLREHGYVVRDIVRILREHCESLDVPEGPSVIGTDALWHLSTFIIGRLKNPRTTALELACALHPTPAICGYPTAAAFQQIQALEPFDREYFAGLVGWQRENGDGEWALTLRCARYDGERSLRLYAGAGTVAGSDPESEIRETATKMETFMRAIA